MSDNIDAIIKVIQDSCIVISELIRTKHSGDLSCVVDSNVSGDEVKQLDILSNNILLNSLLTCKNVRNIGSEEEDNLIPTNNNEAPYLVCYDPLDGSSNIDCNITVGTIFGIYKYENNCIKNGQSIIAVGYCLYGGSTQFIIATELGAKMYLLDNNEFKLINNNLTIKEKSNVYSINESNKHNWKDTRYKLFTEHCISNNYTTRWVGSLVADAHRTIIKGGFFAYPDDKKFPNGKLRVLYEALPFAFIFKIVGGCSSNGKLESLLDLKIPKDTHQKTPLILSSKYEYNIFTNL